ncbi:MAG: dihydrodipicolinate reductase [Acidobacteria bacterium]|nr:dihydrodipicolinate reductase [Acidobacteriota bacterium]
MNRLLLVGHGRMGQLVEQLAPSYGFELAGIVTDEDPGGLTRDHGRIDVAIDFTLPHAVPVNLPVLAGRGINVVVGTTGWQAHEAELRAVVARAGTAVLASANFSLGMNLFVLLAEEAARRFGPHADFGAWIHELHHSAKKDAPSGTALMLQRAMVEAGCTRGIDVAATRAGSIPGTHTIGFDGPSETVTLTHQVRDRGVFARGALEAARWLVGRRGWFSMRDFLTDSGD